MKYQHGKYIAQDGNWGVQAPLRGFAIQTIDIFIRGYHLKYPDFLSQDICFWLGLKSAISSQAWAHKAAEQVWRLNQESTQERCPSSPVTVWIRYLAEGKWRYQYSKTGGPGFPILYFFIRTLKKNWKVNSYTFLLKIDPGLPHLNSDSLTIRPLHMQSL